MASRRPGNSEACECFLVARHLPSSAVILQIILAILLTPISGGVSDRGRGGFVIFGIEGDTPAATGLDRGAAAGV